MSIKKLEIIHFNDLHSNFYTEDIDGVHTGGISYLTNYISKEKQRNKDLICLFAGDALGGDVNDSEYYGVTTFTILSQFGIDAMCPGNHELDYGFPQFVVLSQFSKIPVLCGNIKSYLDKQSFFKPYMTISRDGFNVFVIGITTPSISTTIINDKTTCQAFYVDDYMDTINEAYKSKEYKNADMVIILSHIGFEEDKQLAKHLYNEKPTIIIGGHSHTMLEEPVKENNIDIVQLGLGSTNVGKFIISYDDSNKKIMDTKYEVIEMNEYNCSSEFKVDKYISIIESRTNRIYDAVVCELSRIINNEDRYIETEFGDFMADAFNDICRSDLALFDPGSTKSTSLGPTIRYTDISTAFPRKGEICKCIFTGRQLKKLFSHSLKYYGKPNELDIFLQQVSSGVKIVFDINTLELKTLYINGVEVDDDKEYHVGLLSYSVKNSLKKFSILTTDIKANKEPIIIHDDYIQALYNYLLEKEHIDINIEKRYIGE